MPVVPQAQRTVASRTIQSGQVSTNAGEEVFGGGAGTQALTNSIGGLAQAAGGMINQIDDLEADRAIAEAHKRKNAFMLGDPKIPETDGGFLSKGGKQATVDMDLYKQRMSTSFKELEDGLSNERQRNRFRSGMGQVDAEIDSQMKRHALGETMKYDEQETSAMLANHQQDGIVNYKEIVPVVNEAGQIVGEQSKIRMSIDRQEQIIKGFASRQGYGEESEYTKQKILQAKTATHKGVLEHQIADDQDQLAVDYLKEAETKGEIDGRALPDLKRMVEAGSLRGNSQRESDRIMDSSSSIGSALTEARKIEDPKLRDEVTQRVKVRFAEAESVKNDINKKNYEDMFDQLNKDKTLSKIPPDRLAKLDSSEYKSLMAWELQLNSSKSIVTDQEKWYNLRLMAASPETQDKFTKMNLIKEARMHLSDSDFNTILNLQTNLISGKGSSSDQMDGFRRDNQVIEDKLAGVGIDRRKNKELYSQFASTMDSVITQWQKANGGKNVPNDVLEKMIDEQLIQGTVPGTGVLGTFKTKKRLFEIGDKEQLEIDVNDIPQNSVDQIKKILQKNGREVTNSSILGAWETIRMKKRS